MTRFAALGGLLLLTRCEIFGAVSACAVSPPCAGAVAGTADLGAAALTLDDEVLKVYGAEHPAAQPMPIKAHR